MTPPLEIPTETPEGDTGEAPEVLTQKPEETPAPDQSAEKRKARSAVVPAAASASNIGLTIKIKNDGTPDQIPNGSGGYISAWDADDTAGNDSGPNNGVVRVNDTVTYELEYVVQDGIANQLTWSVTLPLGMEITTLPGYCLTAGSSLIPQTAGSPKLPLTATSIQELSQQTLTCNMGDKQAATDRVAVTAKVLSMAHQGQELKLSEVAIAAEDAEPVVLPEAELPSVTASARLKWDLSKNGIADKENTGYFYGPQNIACPWDANVLCKTTVYSILISSGAAGKPGQKGKGAMPAVGDVTFVDDLSPEAMYPGLSPAQHAAMNADLEKYGSRIGPCGGNFWMRPGDRIGGSAGAVPRTAVNSVRNSGTCTLTQSGPGEPVNVRISGADFSLRTYPTEAISPDEQALPGHAAYAISHGLTVYTPLAAIRDFGVTSGGVTTLTTRNEYNDLEIQGFEQSDVQRTADQPTWNDYRDSGPNVALQVGFNKFFAGVPGESGNMTSGEFAPGGSNWSEGPPGGALMRSGEITAAPEQNVASMLALTGSNVAVPMDVSFLVCDAWDSSKLHLRAADVPGSKASSFQGVPSAGRPVWISGYDNVLGTNGQTRLAKIPEETPDLTVQYSALAGGIGAASECGDAQGPWYEDPEDVPGNDPALAAKGVYTAVSRVRAHVVLPEPAALSGSSSSAGVRAAIMINMQVADTVEATGTQIPNWASRKIVEGENLSFEEMVEHPRAWRQSTYVPETHGGTLGDRLILAQAQARVEKQVRKGASGAFSDSPPQVTGGDLVQYQISPSLTSGATVPGITSDVWVEDCIPASQSYSDASLAPSVVVLGSTPSDAKRSACEKGETYVRWVFPAQEVNRSINPIVLSVVVSPTVADGSYQSSVVVSADKDVSTLARRTDSAGVQVANVAGIKLEKLALTPIVQANRESASTKELNRWLVKLTNTLPDAGVSSPDVIDVLPAQGQDGTVYSGKFKFVSAEVKSGGASTKVLYTSASAPVIDPKDASNGASGSTAWCDAPAGGTRVSGTGACPTSADKVTGLRFQRPGEFAMNEAIEVELALVGTGNQRGDRYVNRAAAAVTGLTFTIGPLARVEEVAASSIGDRVWWDLSRNGLQDDFQSQPEPGAPNVTVKLSGTDDLGNAVSLETRTDNQGNYHFDDLRTPNADGYRVEFVKPGGASGFTLQNVQGATPGNSSVADPATGLSAPLSPGQNLDIDTADAGLLANGSLRINKLLEGAGVKLLNVRDTFEFDVECTFEDALVLDETISLTAQGAAAITSDVLGPLPALSECRVVETAAGGADPDLLPDPVTVTVPWSANQTVPGTATASLTNYFSAGTLQLKKRLEGDAERVAQVKDTEFRFLMTCQVEEQSADESSDPLRVDLFSGTWMVKGGETLILGGEDGKPLGIPLGARCFAQEMDAGGATEQTISHDSFEKSVVVTAGTPSEAQVLEIVAVNTFLCDDESCPPTPPCSGDGCDSELPESPVASITQGSLATTGMGWYALYSALGLLAVAGVFGVSRLRARR